MVLLTSTVQYKKVGESILLHFAACGRHVHKDSKTKLIMSSSGPHYLALCSVQDADRTVYGHLEKV